LRSDRRVGPKAYVAPGGPIAGGTLARDVAFLSELAEFVDVRVPVLGAIRDSNKVQRDWAMRHIQECVARLPEPRIAILGLTYKPGTDTLRRSAAVELALALTRLGMTVGAYDPAIRSLPSDLAHIDLAESPDRALDQADVAVL